MRRALSVRSGAGRPPAAAVCRVRALARVRLASSHVSSYGRQTRSLLQRCCSAAPHCGSAAVSGSGACAGPSRSCVRTAIARAPQRFLKAPQLVRTLRLGAFGASELQLPRTASCAHGGFVCGVSSVADSCGRTGQPADRAPVSRQERAGRVVYEYAHLQARSRPASAAHRPARGHCHCHWCQHCACRLASQTTSP